MVDVVLVGVKEGKGAVENTRLVAEKVGGDTMDALTKGESEDSSHKVLSHMLYPLWG